MAYVDNLQGFFFFFSLSHSALRVLGIELWTFRLGGKSLAHRVISPSPSHFSYCNSTLEMMSQYLVGWFFIHLLLNPICEHQVCYRKSGSVKPLHATHWLQAYLDFTLLPSSPLCSSGLVVLAHCTHFCPRTFALPPHL